jgi:hypothetical protein
MKQKHRCKKCGRLLKSPISIARGMGPKCAGISSVGRRSIHVGVRRSSGKRYQSVGAGSFQMPLMPGEPPTQKVSRRELARRRREERRRLFESRQPFQCGMLSGRKIPLRYEPSGESEWKENASGRLISHERLQAYLKRYQFI